MDGLRLQGVDADAVVAEFGQVAAAEARQAGSTFTLRDHVRGLILSLLSNQRPWGPIAAHLPALGRVFRDYDPDLLETVDPAHLEASIQRLRCGNRQLRRQMESLAPNIARLRRIAAEFGSVDAFVVSDSPERIAGLLSSPGDYKLRQVGPALAYEYLRNVGIRVAKPDVHVRRILSGERLGYFASLPNEAETVRKVDELAKKAGIGATYLDNLLWLYCAQDYGAICTANPRCSVCPLAERCNFSR